MARMPSLSANKRRPMPRSVTKGSRAMRYWVNLSRVQDNIRDVGVHLNGVAKETADELAVEMLDYMKTNAPWNDQTGLAREGLRAQPEENGEQFTVAIFHTVDYGAILETENGGARAILIPTLMYFIPRVGSKLKENA